MTFKINGFGGEPQEEKNALPPREAPRQACAPRKSVVKVRFPGRGMALSYYNDRFDLKIGDLVYVDGKLEGQLGRVTEISYNFKIKLSEYQRVIALCDTNVSGQFFMAGSHFLTFDPAALPAEKAALWFKAPPKEEEYVSSSDDAAFLLEDLSGMGISAAIAERGHNYYLEDRVRYICLDGTQGYAIVEGSEPYGVEFQYHNGQIRNLVCECPCCCACKHEFAAMLQLRDALAKIETHYAQAYAQTGYFAAVSKETLFAFAINGRETGSLTL